MGSFISPYQLAYTLMWMAEQVTFFVEGANSALVDSSVDVYLRMHLDLVMKDNYDSLMFSALSEVRAYSFQVLFNKESNGDYYIIYIC